ncbi:MAG: fructoselysine/glucoselysine system component [Chloroflexota bacterium]|nr:fructoselysine/glucoselysine system component [Chloroflexota bacterium]
MLLSAFLVGLVALLGRAETRFGMQLFIEEPLVMCSLTGLVLGDLKTGLAIGATLQLVFLGNMGIGASTPADQVLGSVLATAIAILSGAGLEVAIALAVPVAALGQALVILVRTTFNVFFLRKAVAYADVGNTKGIDTMHISAGVVYVILTAFLPAFIAVLAGVPAVQALLGAIPEVILSGLRAGAKLLPALGFAVLFIQMQGKNSWVYFMLGFLVVAYFGIDTVGIAALAVCIALIINSIHEKIDATAS